QVEDVMESTVEKKSSTVEGETAEKREKKTPVSTENAGEVTRGKWYLSIVTVSDEAAAQQAASGLKSQGYSNSGYYYIPDYDPSGKKLYKVYIGPFASVEDAENALDDEVRAASPGVYAYQLR
ncbi:MAG TPA: SPOR domain-containing protein, partial [Chitinophagales bacterium]|nr:SPOR domain-containing protein [Chitinophagales bacterium]